MDNTQVAEDLDKVVERKLEGLYQEPMGDNLVGFSSEHKIPPTGNDEQLLSVVEIPDHAADADPVCVQETFTPANVNY